MAAKKKAKKRPGKRAKPKRKPVSKRAKPKKRTVSRKPKRKPVKKKAVRRKPARRATKKRRAVKRRLVRKAVKRKPKAKRLRLVQGRHEKPSLPELAEEELALRMLDVYFTEVARYGVKRQLTLDEVINSYFYSLLRVQRKGIELNGIENIVRKGVVKESKF